jgi:hypothetical protein
MGIQIVAGCWIVAGYWLLVAGFWFLVFGSGATDTEQLPATSNQQPDVSPLSPASA